jgi:hypothetical protein
VLKEELSSSMMVSYLVVHTRLRKNRPWTLVCYGVARFKNESIGLQFEWAFQHSRRSKMIFRYALLPGRRMVSTTEIKATSFLKDTSAVLVGYLCRLLILLCKTHFGSNELTDGNSLTIHFSSDAVYGKFNQELIDDLKRG